MKTSDIQTWLYPLDAWVKARVQAEDDPEGEWHLTGLAYAKLKQCFDTCALGSPPLWEDEDVAVDLEFPSEGDATAVESEEISEVSSLQAEDEGEGAVEEDSSGESSDLRAESPEDVAFVDEPVESE